MSGRDSIGCHEVRDIILDLRRGGSTILFSTHILSDAEMLCDRVGMLVGGKLRGVGSPDQLVGMKVSGMEVLFEFAADPAAAASSLLAKAIHTGDRYRLEVPAAGLYKTL